MGGELLGGARDGRRTLSREKLRDLGGIDDFDKLAVQPLDDLLRHARRANHSAVEHQIEPGQGRFGDCRNVLHCRDSRRRGHGERAELSALHMRQRRRHGRKNKGDIARDHRHGRRRAALVGHVQQIDARHRFEGLARQMDDGTGAGRGVVELPGSRFRQRDQLGHRLCGQRRIDDEQKRRRGHQTDEREILDAIVRELAVQARVDRMRGGIAEVQRVAVGGRPGDDLGGDRGAGAGAVVDDDLLAEILRQPGTEGSREHVGDSPGREPDHEADGFVRIRLCPSVCAENRESEDGERADHDGFLVFTERAQAPEI